MMIFIIMFKLFLTVILILWLVYLVGKYVFKPYLRMLRYVKYQGAIWVPFVPILGAFKHA
jgi:hypothetical protein